MFDPWVRKIPWRRECLLTPVFLPGEFHGQRSLAGYSPWGNKVWDMTERHTLTFTLIICTCRRRRWHPTPVFLLEKSPGWRSLVGCSPWGRWELDTAEWLHFHFSLSCIGEGHGNPLQCSCLENPRDEGAWWAAIYGVAQSQIRLQRLTCTCKKYQH